jgi:hypothetical protein
MTKNTKNSKANPFATVLVLSSLILLNESQTLAQDSTAAPTSQGCHSTPPPISPGTRRFIQTIARFEALYARVKCSSILRTLGGDLVQGFEQPEGKNPREMAEILSSMQQGIGNSIRLGAAETLVSGASGARENMNQVLIPAFNQMKDTAILKDTRIRCRATCTPELGHCEMLTPIPGSSWQEVPQLSRT